MCLLRKHDLEYGNDSRQNGPFDLGAVAKAEKPYASEERTFFLLSICDELCL
jgi:hypothetical protein